MSSKDYNKQRNFSNDNGDRKTTNNGFQWRNNNHSTTNTNNVNFENDGYKRKNSYNNNYYRNERSNKNQFNNEKFGQNSSSQTSNVPIQKDYRNINNFRPQTSFHQPKYDVKNDSNKYTQMRKEQQNRNTKAFSIEYKSNTAIDVTKKLIVEKMKNKENDFDKLGIKVEAFSNKEHMVKCDNAEYTGKVFNILYEIKKYDVNQIHRISKYFERFNEEKYKKTMNELKFTYQDHIKKHDIEMEKVQRLINTESLNADLLKTYNDHYQLLLKQKEAFTVFFENLIKEYNKYSDISYRMKIGKDARIKFELNELESEFKRECLKFEAKLPLYGYKSEILQDIQNYQVFILKAQTGSGKSTQLPQYLTQCKEFNGKIVCTQPRRIAAMSLAKQVALEMLDKKVGYQVGYSIGQHARMRKKTKIMYMTDSKFLNEVLEDRKLKNYSIMIVDEAHERGVYSELLISMLRECLKQRKDDFKIFISSATINTDIFSDYFKDFKVKLFNIPSRLYPVEVIYCPYREVVDNTNNSICFDDFYEEDMFIDLPSDYHDIDELSNDSSEKSIKNDNNYETSKEYVIQAVEKAVDLAKSTQDGDILVFLTGVAEIEEACVVFQNNFYEPDLFLVLQLHGSMNPDEQNEVFKEYVNKKDQRLRKIIFSTNVAETSITIAHVKYIIDSGKEKSMKYDAVNDISILEVGNISQSSADQRKGRAGRTQPGFCYRMYSEKEYNRMQLLQTSEIMRINIAKSMLKLMDLQVKDVINFDFIEKPNKDNLIKAFDYLIKIGAIKNKNDQHNKYEADITEIGRLIARLPFEPHLSLLIINAINKKSKYLIETIALASLLSQSDIFYRSVIEDEEELSKTCRLYFSDIDGDGFTLLHVLLSYLKIDPNERDDWCRQHSLNFRTMRAVFNQIYEAVVVYNKSTFGKQFNLKFASNIENDMNEMGKIYNKQLTKINGVNDEIRLDEGVKDDLLNIMFETFKEKNICQYTGIANLYYSNLHKFIKIFPAQTYPLTHNYPEFICYERLLLTESKYLIGVQNMCRFFQNSMNNSFIEWKNFYTICEKNGIGGQIMRQLIGKSGVNLRKTEKELRELYNIEWCQAHVDNHTNSFKILFKNGDVSSDVIKEYIENKVNNCIRIAQNRTIPIPISNDAFAIVRDGGHIMDFIKFSNKTVLIVKNNNSKPEISENHIRERFEVFGSVKAIHLINNQNKCFQQENEIAIIEYDEEINIAKAVLESSKWNDYKAVLSKKNIEAQQSSMYETSLKFCWQRRTRKNFAFIKFENIDSSIVGVITRSGPLYLNGNPAKLNISKKNNLEIQITNLQNTVTENQIKSAFDEKFSQLNVIIRKIDFVYDQAFVTSEIEFQNIKRQLHRLIENTKLVKRNQYVINMSHPKDNYVRYEANVQLKLLSDKLKQLCNVLLSSSVTGFPNLSINYKILIKIQSAIYSIFSEEINSKLNELNVKTKSHSKEVQIEFESSDFDSIDRIRVTLLNLIKYQELNLNDKTNEFTKKLETKQFKKNINTIILDTKTYIDYDRFTKLIKVYGNEDNIKLAIDRLNSYFIVLESKSIETIDLNNYLPVVFLFNKNVNSSEKLKVGIKWLFDKYGPNLKKLYNYDDNSQPKVSYDLSENLLLFEGNKNDYNVLISELEKMKHELEKQVKTDDQSTIILCCSNELNCKLRQQQIDFDKNYLTCYKLSLCGHIICNLCFNSKFSNEQSIQLPIKCDKCIKDNSVVAEDLVKICNNEQLRLMLWHGLNEYANDNQNKYYKCTNKNCLMMHDISNNNKFCHYCS